MSKGQPETSAARPTLSRAERETQTAAERLSALIEGALASVAVRTAGDGGELEAAADRIERAARDLTVALRELAEQRQRSADEE